MKRALLFSLLVLWPAVLFGVPSLRYRDFKEHRQRSPEAMEYLGGEVSINVQDGDWNLSPCIDDPALAPSGSNPLCPLGVNGLIIAGDIDEDGIRDDGLFFSIASVNAATELEPFRSDIVRMLASPGRTISSTLSDSRGAASSVFDVTDTSVIIFYNFLRTIGTQFNNAIRNDDFTVREYRITRVDLNRAYGPGEAELQRHYSDFPFASDYLFQFAALNDPQRGVLFGVSHIITPDAWPGRGHARNGWRGINDRWTADGRMEFDPRVFNELFTLGVDPSNTVSSDQLRYSFRSIPEVFVIGDPDGVPDSGDEFYEPNAFGVTEAFPGPDALVGTDDDVPNFWKFPPIRIQNGSSRLPIRLDSPYQNTIQIPPFFFQHGEEMEIVLEWRRILGAGARTTDISGRTLRIPIRFVDSWDGFSFFSAPFSVGGFPLGTSSRLRRPNLDFDGDGANNLMEFALNTDLADGTAFPTTEVIPNVADPTQFGPDGIIRFQVQPGDPTMCTATAFKRPNVGESIKYQFEYSTNMTTWSLISPGSPDWTVTEDDTMLMVSNVAQIGDVVDDECYIRLRVRLNTRSGVIDL